MTTSGGNLDRRAASSTTRRSARRQTVRATCSAAAFGVPPGRMNGSSGSSSASPASIARSSSAMRASSMRAFSRCCAHLRRGRAWRAARRSRTGRAGSATSTSSMRGIGSTARAKPSDGVQLVDVAVGLDARMVLGHAAAAEQTRVAVVAGLRVDLHGGRNVWRARSSGRAASRQVALSHSPAMISRDYATSRSSAAVPPGSSRSSTRACAARRRRSSTRCRSSAASSPRSIPRSTSSTSPAFRRCSPRIS